MSAQHLIIGNDEPFDIAKDICKGTKNSILIELNSNNDYDYNLDFLDEFDPTIFSCTIALGPHAINFPRIDVLMKVSFKGYRISSLISQNSDISDSAKLQNGVIIGRNVSVKHNVSIGLGSVIYPNAIIGSDSVIKAHVSILDHATILDGCQVGLGSTIGRKVTLSKGTTIGRHCEILLEKTYNGKIRDRYYCDEFFPNGMYIF